MADSIAKINATADQLRAQNQELEQAAKKSKGKLSYTPVSEADIESARQAALAKAQTDFIAGLRTLVGTAAPLSVQFADLDRQFRQLSDDAKAAGVDVAALSSVLAAQFAGLVQTQAAPILDARAALAASIDGLQGIDNTLRNVEEARAALANNTNPALELSLIQRVQTAVEARYSSELARLQQLKTLGDYAKGLTLSDLSTATPAARLIAARNTYLTDLDKARGGDQDAIGRLQGEADAYLKEARSYYASSAEYTKIFEGVRSDLGTLGATAAQDIENLQDSTVAELQGLQGKVTDLLQPLIDTASATAETAVNTGKLSADQGKLVTGILAYLATPGANSAGLAALVGNTQGTAGEAVNNTPTTGTDTATEAHAQTGYDTQAFTAQLAKDVAKKGFSVAEAKGLEKFFVASNTADYNAGDWALWKGVIQDILTQEAALRADGREGGADRAHDLAATINAKLPQEFRAFAQGGFAAPGWALVGEQGPELVNFTDPARVYTASQTASALSQVGTATPQGPDLAAALDRQTAALSSRADKSDQRIVSALNLILQALQDGHAISEDAARNIAREVRLGLAAKRVA